MTGGDRFFRAELAAEVGIDAAPGAHAARERRAGGRRGAGQSGAGPRRGCAFLATRARSRRGFVAETARWRLERAARRAARSARSARRLIVRIEKPGLFSQDAPLSGEESEIVALRVQIARHSCGPEGFGRFSLQASQVPPFTIFVPLQFLQERVEHEGSRQPASRPAPTASAPAGAVSRSIGNSPMLRSNCVDAHRKPAASNCDTARVSRSAGGRCAPPRRRPARRCAHVFRE